MRKLFFILFFLLFATWFVSGQISGGGWPMEIPRLKSRDIPVVVMPPVDNDELQVMHSTLQPELKQLKAFRFAVGFDVDISPELNGAWFSGLDGFDVWKIRIRSKGAYSISLLFEKFHLPPGARLFLFNENEGHYLGAFTSYNNKTSGKFAVSPVAGEEITVQYEVPAGTGRAGDFVITQVSHDYLGILKNERRPMKIKAGSCNTDINCSAGAAWKDVKDAVCRIIISKPDQPGKPKEICTGTLINNTAENQKPYIITAAHCFDKKEYAETAVFTFNYESPFCAPLDGDPVHSISGASLLASSDSLDFALVELSLIPPPEFRPFYAGWDKRKYLPDSSVSIHHPQGDIKKIAVDRDSPRYSDFSSGYTPGGFLKIEEWEEGVTEAGSSGGGLFSPTKHLIGTLTGGVATCYNPVDDYFSRFDLAWEYLPDSSKQLKYWLDPIQKNVQMMPGKRYYNDENLCVAFTNLEDFDEHQNVVLRENNQFAGYWGGSNSSGITEFAERYVVPGNIRLHGLSMGVGKRKLSEGTTGEIKVNVYNGGDVPETRIFSKTVKIDNLVSDAMNFIEFSNTVAPADTFFVGFELSNMQSQDTFVVYQSLRQTGEKNFFWFRQDDDWYNFQSVNQEGLSMTSVFELIACNVKGMETDTPLVHNPLEVLIYPNPARTPFTFEAGQEFTPGNIRIFNLIGQEVNAKLTNYHNKKIQIDLRGNVPGVYFVQLKTDEGKVAGKVSYIPW
jgi:lysyl endopeptidase